MNGVYHGGMKRWVKRTIVILALGLIGCIALALRLQRLAEEAPPPPLHRR